MAIENEKIKKFFDAYARRFNEALRGNVNIDKTAAAFADCFVEASPIGVQCAQNDERFKEAIQGGYEFYKHIGTKSMEITGIDVTPIDDLHAMVRVHWRAEYRKKDRQNLSIEFDITYMVQMIDERIMIFAYVTGDEHGVLREHGLLDETVN